MGGKVHDCLDWQHLEDLTKISVAVLPCKSIREDLIDKEVENSLANS